MLTGETLFDRKIAMLGALVARSDQLRGQPAAVRRAIEVVADITWRQAERAYRRRRGHGRPYEVFEAIGYLVARSSRIVDDVAE
jgi:hypothetical protein